MTVLPCESSLRDCASSSSSSSAIEAFASSSIPPPEVTIYLSEGGNSTARISTEVVRDEPSGVRVKLKNGILK